MISWTINFFKHGFISDIDKMFTWFIMFGWYQSRPLDSLDMFTQSNMTSPIQLVNIRYSLVCFVLYHEILIQYIGRSVSIENIQNTRVNKAQTVVSVHSSYVSMESPTRYVYITRITSYCPTCLGLIWFFFYYEDAHPGSLFLTKLS